MEIKKPRVFSATENLIPSKTLLGGYKDWQTFSRVPWGEGHFVFEVGNNRSLPVVYNEAIEQALSDNVDCLILVHDDVILEEDPIPKLEQLFGGYDLIGVAGPSKVEIGSPALWHIMGGGFQGGHLHGCVQHLHKEAHGYGHDVKFITSKPKSNFGPYPNRVVMIDGVFMALSRKLLESGVRFDENIPSKFHFYDLDFSLSVAQTENLKVGVGDILITHASPGLREFTPEWLAGEQYFLQKHGN